MWAGDRLYQAPRHRWCTKQARWWMDGTEILCFVFVVSFMRKKKETHNLTPDFPETSKTITMHTVSLNHHQPLSATYSFTWFIYRNRQSKTPPFTAFYTLFYNRCGSSTYCIIPKYVRDGYCTAQQFLMIFKLACGCYKTFNPWVIGTVQFGFMNM